MPDYSLHQIDVFPKDLILDPRNPRIISSPTDYLCCEGEDFSKESIQAKVLEFLNKPKYKIKNLENSILRNGFLDIDSIFVKKYQNGKYLVLEGNRRTAAITNLRLKSTTPKEILSKLKRIPVKLVDFEKGTDEEKVIAQLLSIRHLDGPLEWEPMQQAFSVLNHYMKYFSNIHKEKEFFYDTKIRAELESDLGLTPKDIINKISIAKIFQQLKEFKFNVSSNHYSIIERVIMYPKLSTGYFGYNWKVLTFDNEGVQNFAYLCIEKSRVIKEPKKVRNLYNYYINGRADLINQLLRNDLNLEEAEGIFKSKGNNTRFINSLTKAKKELKKIRLSDFNGSSDECKLIKELKSIVDKLNTL